MYLKNLTVLGFKSFADKTSLNFLPGITAIVGPNGCGKSNVADAIRWVLGEQSAKALRGGEMADVIFNGTDSRKPLGMAEVSLTIGDVDKDQLRAAGVEMDYNEVTVTRRVFRDGGSEYFINKTSCRLKDIQQLFMGTGVGRTSYSIMAQGNITQILSSKPEDRRMVFEEAAGITKFKTQKKEALRKLEHTDQNLLRVEDLIKEVKRQIGSLQRQAGKARRYKQIMVELQHLDTQLARHNFDVLQNEITERDERLRLITVEIESSSSGVNRAEDELTQLRARLAELEQEISLSQQRGLELKGQIDRHESRIHFNEERLRELENQNAKALGDIAQAEERRLISEQELNSVTQRLAETEVKLAEHKQTLESRRESLHGVEQELMGKQEDIRRNQSELFSAAQELSRVRNQINQLDLQKQGNIVRLEKLHSEKVQLEEERTRLEARLAEFSANAEADKLNIQVQRGTVEERQARLKEIQQELSQTSQQLDGLVRQQAEKRSRLNVLEQLEESHEGFSGGAQAALKQSQAVLGSLADKIRVPDQYIKAVETVLGQNLQLVLTEQPEAAVQILADLSNNKKGKASIAAVSLLQGRASAVVEPTTFTVGTTSVLSIMEVEEAFKPLLECLVGRTLIVDDLNLATTAYRECNGRHDFVTMTGELLNAYGVYNGGQTNGNNNGKAPSSILGRKNQIAELKGQLAQLQEQVNEFSRQRGALQSEQTTLQASLQEAQTQLRTQEVAIASREGEFRALQNSMRVLLQKTDTVGYEIDNLSNSDREGAEKREAMAARIGELEHREASLQAQLADMNYGLEGLRQQRDVANAALTEAKVAMATDEQMLASFRNQVRPLQQRISEMQHLADTRRNEMGSFLQRKEQAEVEIAESRQRIEALQHERAQVNDQTTELVGDRDKLNVDIDDREGTLRDQRQRVGVLQSQKGTIEVELAQKGMAVQNLRERVQQKYQLNLDDIRSECITITDASEGTPKIETLTPEEMASRGMATDWNQVSEQVSMLQKRVDEMGPVNLVAIEEYEETEQRYQFLTTQHDDLVNAKTELMDVINRINTQTREMFITTFNQIRDNFRVMFTEIFGGGKADLVLADEANVLESGIDIVARPPGKQLQSITLLSGGEQTMTAVSLLFSIYQVKPSPFCVLDELDAPLDESNINRFLRVLKRFLDQSQFVIITHNKRTIGIADVLYGVTMQEQGVSRIVSVKFHKADEAANANGAAAPEQGKPLVPPPVGGTVNAQEDALHKREETLELAESK
ncbi:MAG TPA: chromosome segregation protein SMC [Verrucomicrobiae bacterium]